MKIFLSSLRLLSICKSAVIIHADTTYKLVWQGLPVLMTGTTDKNKVFHPFGIGVCDGEAAEDFEFIFKSIKTAVFSVFKIHMEPKILQADASDAITRGFELVFGKQCRLMCWFHVIKKIEEKSRSLKKEDSDKIRNDLNFLQLCPSPEAFDRASELFKIEWLEHEDIHFYLCRFNFLYAVSFFISQRVSIFIPFVPNLMQH